MPTIENHAEHAFHLPKLSHALPGEGPLQAEAVSFQESVTFPRAGKPDDEGNPEPSRTKVSPEVLERLRKHPIAKGWFKPAGGKLQLRVAETDVPEASVVPDENALGAPNKAARKQ